MRCEPGSAFGDLRVDQVHRRRSDESGHEPVPRFVVQRERTADLLQYAVLQNRDPITHRHGLDLIVCDVYRGHPEPVLEFRYLRAGLHP
jgi:hypothetical protein